MPGSRRPTLKDVARHAGVSTAVVSYVVNSGPRTVAPDTRRRVERSIGELGYRRDAIAGALSAGRSCLLGLLVPDLTNGFFGELALEVERAASRRGLVTMVGNVGYEEDALNAYVAAFSDLRPHGVFIASASALRDHNAAAPVVHLHAASANPGGRSVVFDNAAGAAEATRHLVQTHGISDVHCFTAGREGPSEERAAGWRSAMRRARLPSQGLLHRLPAERVAAEQAAAQVLRSTRLPRAVFATSDELALATLRAAARLRLRVPEDVAVVGFDGIREALLGSTRLATVQVPLEQLAERGLDALARVAGDGATPAREVLPTAFRAGETCGCD